MKLKYIYYLLPIVLIGLLGSCTKDGPYSLYKPTGKYNGNIYDYLKSQPEHFQYLLVALDKAGLTDVLTQDSITFFVPTDQSLLAAMDKYNVFRKSQQLSPVAINDIDSSSWRYILLPYLFEGVYPVNAFDKQDGLTLTSMALRPMHGKVIRHNASGADGLGATTIEFSYTNGSTFIVNWISGFVSTPNVYATNGIIHILEARHILGFNYFIHKAKAPQNLYSENRTFASGSIDNPDGTSNLWSFYTKSLTAVNANTVETEAVTNDLEPGLVMWLTVEDNDSVIVKAAPGSLNTTIKNDGPCFFDPENFNFILNYSYEDGDGKHKINETIRYIAIREK